MNPTCCPNFQLPQIDHPYYLNPQLPPASQLYKLGNPNKRTTPVNNAPINHLTFGPITFTGPITNITNKVEITNIEITQTIELWFMLQHLTIIQ